MGYPAHSAHTKVRRLLPAAAVPAAAAGIAAAFALGNTPAATSATAAISEPTGTLPAGTATAPAPAPLASAEQLLSFTRQPTTGHPLVRLNAAKVAAIKPKGRHHRAPDAKYRVKSGDTLASIAQDVYHSPDYWPVLYWANRTVIKYANAITAGQELAVPAKPAKIPSPPKELASAPTPGTTAASTTTGTSYSAASTSSTATTSTASTTSQSSASGSTSAFQACVIAAESGGNAQIMNSSGHYGLYQFSASTWAEYGGNPADFGHASVAEQNQVFANAMAAGGESNWAPYDGC